MTFIKAAIEEEIALQKVTRESKKKVAMSYKHAILAMNGVEMIPFLLKTYDPGTDMDMLTLFMLLMIDNEYIPFITSPFYCGFYENGYSKKREGKYATAIEDEILRQVTAFSNEKKYRK
ncbi:hypothetical protein [Chitinophaga arvensicola]|nr:hypothetical protein [Chitinophaga arvensicola]